MKIERKRLVLLSLLIFGGITAFAQKISKNVMQKIYDEVKTPYKYGMVVAPKDNYHQIDCPMVYREGGKWYTTARTERMAEGMKHGSLPAMTCCSGKSWDACSAMPTRDGT